MTRDEAVKIWITFGCRRVEADFRRHVPEHVADRFTFDNAEDCIDGLIALGLLVVDQSSPAPEETSQNVPPAEGK